MNKISSTAFIHSQNHHFLDPKSYFDIVIPVTTHKHQDSECAPLFYVDDIMHYDHVTVISQMWPPVNDYLISLFLLLDRLEREGVSCISLIMPYMPYMRQDRETKKEGKLLSISCLARILHQFKLHSIISCDLHKPQLQGVFYNSFHCVTSESLFISDIITRFDKENICIVSPDVGGIYKAMIYAEQIGCSFTYLYNKRNNSKNENVHLNTDIHNKICIIVDDIIASGRTMCYVAEHLYMHKAKEIHIYVTHFMMNKNDYISLTKSHIMSITTTNTCYQSNTLKESTCIHHTNNDTMRTLSVDQGIISIMKKIYCYRFK